jgi:hypothetical protein
LSRSPGGSAGRAGRWLALLAGLSLAASGLLAIFGDAFEVVSWGPDAFSRSALGHHALLETWRALGHRVLVSRSRTAAKLGGEAALVVAEPMVGSDRVAAERLAAMLEASPRSLLVLPKRAGAPDPLRGGWIGRQFVLPPEEAARVLEAAGIEGQVVRPAATPAAWTGGPVPDLAEPQLVRSRDLVPLVACGEGILLGVREAGEGGGEVVVLADPDLIANHGLGRGDNALLAASLAERLAGQGQATLVVDETLHGHEQEPSLARELLAWPLVLATVQAGLVLLLASWAAWVRFGRPHRDAPALAPGKAFLIENTADLLRHGGHGGSALGAYWRGAREHVARAFPSGLPGEAPDAGLARAAAARGRSAELADLERRVAALAGRRGGEELVRAAAAICDFREEMTHGAEPHP